MANIDSLGYDGLQTKDYNTLLSEIQDFLQTNYSPNGEQISFDSNTPDGQFTEILANIGATVRELIANVYNATDPSKCDSTQQDTKYQLNYLFRKGGSWTLQDIDISVNKTVTLQGLDGDFDDNNGNAFTVSDDSGNNWYLVDTTTITQNTTKRCEFRAQSQGEVIPTIGTITNMVTIVDGVISVNNTQGYTSVGSETESDLDFRLRRERSTSITSQGTADAILSNILALKGVIKCNIHDNDTNSTDATSTPAHTLWIIVDGGANEDIANIIYANKGGSGTRGNVIIPILTHAGQSINIKFDRPITSALYIKFDIQPIDATQIDRDVIRKYIAENLSYSLGENAETSKITTVCANAMDYDGGDGYALDVQISSGGSATASVSGTGLTSASVIASTFQDVIGDVSGSYVFTYTANGWTYSSDVIEISNYGISYVGTPAVNDTITVAYTQGTWSDFISASSIQHEFVTNENRIYITVL